MSNANANNQSDRLRVLIADDVQVTRRSTRLMMSLIPNLEVVAIAHNGRQAVEMARKHLPDIALMDVKMPEMDGLQATQAILKHNPDIACIILSAERDSHTLRQAITAGARGYLIKPFTSEQLVQTLNRIIEQIKVNKARYGQTDRLKKERDSYLTELASEYIKARRTDDKAMEVFESLAENPDCEMRWLRHLAIIYVLREQWGKLKILADRLDKQKKPSNIPAQATN